MIGSLITSQTRIKLLKKFFLNRNTCSHLRGLEAEFGESTNSIRLELNRLEKAGLLNSARQGNKKLYRANCNHPFFEEIHNLILKETGIDTIIENVIKRIGNLISIYLIGDFAQGRDGQSIDLILVGEGIDSEYLSQKVIQAEKLTKRKINYTIIDPENARVTLENFEPAELLPLWNSEGD